MGQYLSGYVHRQHLTSGTVGKLRENGAKVFLGCQHIHEVRIETLLFLAQGENKYNGLVGTILRNKDVVCAVGHQAVNQLPGGETGAEQAERQRQVVGKLRFCIDTKLVRRQHG